MLWSDTPARRTPLSYLPAPPDIVMLAYAVAGNAMAPFVPLYARQLGMGAGTIGLLLGVPGFGALLVSIVAGAWLARFGARNLVLGASIVGVAALLAVWAWGSVAMLVVVLPLFWAVQPLVAIASQMLVITRADAQGRDRAIGMHTFYSSLGASIGPLLGSAVVHATENIASVFLVGAVTSAVACVIAFLESDAGRVEVARPAPFLAGLGDIPAAVRISLAVILLAEFCYVGWTTFFPLALGAAGRRPEVVGVLFAIYGIALAAIRPVLAFLSRRLGRGGVLILALGLITAGLWASTVPHALVLAIPGAVLLGWGFGLVFPITILLVTTGAEGERAGRLLAARFFVMMAGGTLGPVLTGVVAGRSLIGALAAMAALATATTVWAALQVRSRPQAFLDTRKTAMLR